MRKIEMIDTKLIGINTKKRRLFALIVIVAIISNPLHLCASEWSLSMAVVAKVNGEPITKYDIEELAGMVAKRFVNRFGEDNLTDKEKEKIARNALQTLVRSKIIRQISKKNSIYVNGERIDDEIKRKNLPDTRLSRRMVKDDLLFDKIMRTMGKPVLEAGPREVRDFYNKNKKLFIIPRQIKARHITVTKATAMTRSIELRKIKRYLKEAKAGYMPFAELASKRATSDIDKRNGGLLLPPGSNRTGGFFRIDNDIITKVYPVEMVKALRMLKKGEISDVVESKIGFHILLSTTSLISPFFNIRNALTISTG